MKKYKFVKVDWDDACGSASNRWRDIEQLMLPPSRIVSVGWLIFEDKKFITITSSIDDSGHCCNDQTIPRGCIVKITRVKL